MSLGHEKLDVYRMSIAYVAWVYEQSETLKGLHRFARDQWLRASQSIPLNIAEGNGKSTNNDRRKYFVPSQRRQFSIARGSALECAAIQDVLHIGGALDEKAHLEHKNHLNRIAIMLSKLGGRGYVVEEEPVSYDPSNADLDFDEDFDFDSGSQPNPNRHRNPNP